MSQLCTCVWASYVALVVKNPPANAGDARDVGSIPGSGKSLGGGNGTTLQYFCQENFMGRGAWQATVHGATKSWIQLSTYAHMCTCVCILFQVLFHYRLLHAIEYSSLCYTVGPSYLFYIWSEVLVAQLCPTLWFPMGCSLSGSYAHGTLQAKILQWVAIPFSKRSSWPRNQTLVSCIAGRFFTVWATRYIYSSGYSETSFIKALLTFYEGSTFMI